MTCIVGMVGSDGRVTLGGDSAGTEIGVDADHQITEMAAKVYQVGDFVVGVDGSSRVAQVIRQHVMPAAEAAFAADSAAGVVDDVEAWLLECFVPILRKHLRAHGALETRRGEQVMNGNLMLGLGGHLFWMGCNFALTEPVHRFYANGSGRDVALGSLHELDRIAHPRRLSDRAARFVLGHALEAAEYYVPSVRGPFTFVSTPARVAVDEGIASTVTS